MARNIPRNRVTNTPLKHIQKQTCETCPWDKLPVREGHSKTYTCIYPIYHIIIWYVYIDLCWFIQYSFVQTCHIAMHLTGMSSILQRIPPCQVQRGSGANCHDEVIAVSCKRCAVGILNNINSQSWWYWHFFFGGKMLDCRSRNSDQNQSTLTHKLQWDQNSLSRRCA